jgi:putative transposase
VIPVQRQCEIVDLSRSSFYYEAKPPLDSVDLKILHRMDAIYTAHPFYGYRSIRDELVGEGFPIGNDQVLKYMKILGLEAIYPKKKTTIADKTHKVYPYLLKGVAIKRSNQVWASDITYIRLAGGFCYLVVIMDWHSRCVLSWRVSNSLHVEFCVSALQEALRKYGKPEIFNTDQGSQFTSEEFTKILKEQRIQISMDSKGRWADNVIVERFFRTVKYQDIFIKDYKTIQDVREGLQEYLQFYNERRRHTSVQKRTPRVAYEQDFQMAVLKNSAQPETSIVLE